MHSVDDLLTRVFPSRYADASLSNFDTNGSASLLAALAAAKRMADREIANLVLVGPPGTGKTHLAVGVIKYVVATEDAVYRASVAEHESQTADLTWRDDRPYWPAQPESPMWVNVASLIVSLRMQMDAPLDDRDAAAAVRMIRRHRAIVVLDDLGREKTSDWTGEIMYDLVNARYEQELPTIVTSNLGPAELAASPYWPAISRLAEDGALIHIQAADHRLRKEVPA